MKLLRTLTLATGIALAGTSAFAMSQVGATQAQIKDANAAVFVQYDSAVGLPEVSSAYTKADLQKWLARNPSLADEFDRTNFEVADVDAAIWEDGMLRLYVQQSDNTAPDASGSNASGDDTAG